VLIEKATTIIDILSIRALREPEQLAYSFLLDNKSQEVRITYRELDLRVRALASSLREINGNQAKAILLYSPGLEFVIAFLACLCAGVVAVPLNIPRNLQKLQQLEKIVLDIQAGIILTSSILRDNLKKQFVQSSLLNSLALIETETIVNNNGLPWQQLSQQQLAFLQYTSGSTGFPKGVMVTHQNIMYNQQMMSITNPMGESGGKLLSWLPPFHDMGLMGGIIQPLYLGIPGYLISPMTFFQNPYIWLEQISRHRITISPGPNFAYDLCCQKITDEQKIQLDLSSWQIALNGAEPIRAETIENFSKSFAICGFQPQAFYPAYGMAEATVFIAGPVPNFSAPKVISIDAQALQEGKIIQANKDSQKIKKLVGCGKAWLDEKIIIVNPQSFAQSPVNCVGEIWVSGANVAQGYWNQPELTRAVFQASLLDTGEGPFLRTGDLGFIQDDQLFITGRLKDLIIIRGRNFYPQDIEQAVESSHQSLRPAGGAAFAIDIDGQEQLVIVQEVERAYTRNLDAKAIFKAILQVQDIQPYAIVLIKHGSIAKTSSGKVQRHICKENFLNGNLVILEQWFKHHQKFIESPNEITLENIQSYLVQKLANYSGLTIDDIELEESFAAYGLDSSFAVTIAEDLSTMFDCQVSPLLFWQYQNIKDLAEFIASEYIVS